MTELNSDDVFLTAKNAQDAGILQLLPPMQGKQGPGERFFESLQKYLLETFDLEQLDLALYHLAPAIHFMADPAHWEPEEFTGDDMFMAVLHLQQMGVFGVAQPKVGIPGAGDRFFEKCQRILLDKIGVENMEYMLTVLGQCIKFLASEEAMAVTRQDT